MSKVVESVDVAVPVHTAYNQWTQFEEFPAFMSNVREIRQVNDTMTHWVVEVGGMRREFDAKITEQHPDERVAWASIDGPRHAGVVTFHRLDDSHSRVTAQMDIDPEGFVESVAEKTGMIDRIVKGDMQRFRKFIEERGEESGAWRGDVPRPDETGTGQAAKPGSWTSPSSTAPGSTAPGSTASGSPMPGGTTSGGGMPGSTPMPGSTSAPGSTPTPGNRTPDMQAMPDADDDRRPL